jgi:hypothetical protein
VHGLPLGKDHVLRHQQVAGKPVCLPFQRAGVVGPADHLATLAREHGSLAFGGQIPLAVQFPVTDLVRDRKPVPPEFGREHGRIERLVDLHLPGPEPRSTQNVGHTHQSRKIIEVVGETEMRLEDLLDRDRRSHGQSVLPAIVGQQNQGASFDGFFGDKVIGSRHSYLLYVLRSGLPFHVPCDSLEILRSQTAGVGHP